MARTLSISPTSVSMYMTRDEEVATERYHNTSLGKHAVQTGTLWDYMEKELANAPDSDFKRTEGYCWLAAKRASTIVRGWTYAPECSQKVLQSVFSVEEFKNGFWWAVMIGCEVHPAHTDWLPVYCPATVGKGAKPMWIHKTRLWRSELPVLREAARRRRAARSPPPSFPQRPAELAAAAARRQVAGWRAHQEAEQQPPAKARPIAPEAARILARLNASAVEMRSAMQQRRPAAAAAAAPSSGSTQQQQPRGSARRWSGRQRHSDGSLVTDSDDDSSSSNIRKVIKRRRPAA